MSWDCLFSSDAFWQLHRNAKSEIIQKKVFWGVTGENMTCREGSAFIQLQTISLCPPDNSVWNEAQQFYMMNCKNLKSSAAREIRLDPRNIQWKLFCQQTFFCQAQPQVIWSSISTEDELDLFSSWSSHLSTHTQQEI